MAESKVIAAYADAVEPPALPSAGVAAAAPGVVPDDGAAAPDAALLALNLGAAGTAATAAAEAPPSARRPHVLLALSGSVATIKAGALCEALMSFADVRVVATRSSLHFFDESQLPAACRPVAKDADEWRQWQRVGDPVVHIELRRWADALVIAPLSANSLAKVANGLCDNLLTCVVRAWDFAKPLLVAPAMNTFMWDSPFTGRHLAACGELGIKVVPPVNKRLACGDVGAGGMAGVEEIAHAARAALAEAGFQIDTAVAQVAEAVELSIGPLA